MPVQHIHAFVVHPGKGPGREKVEINGTSVPFIGPIFRLLNNIYTGSDEECDIDITFRPTSDGKQNNPCRDLLIKYLRSPGIENGKVIAERLRDHTDGRSGLGLLFLISGRENADHKMIISRFPTDTAIYVEEKAATLTVEFLERVFMKNKASYKAVVYRGSSLHGGFWRGRAVDKQINDPSAQLSDYWIANFLFSQFTITSAAGTRRLAIALRDAVNRAPLEVKEEVIAAITLARGLEGKSVSIDSFEEQFHLSPSAREIISSGLKTARAVQEVFTFDINEFRNFIAYKSVELDNGALLTAGMEKFEDVFQRRNLDSEGAVEFSTQGKIVDEKLRKQR